MIKYIPQHFFGGILHCVQNDVLKKYVILSDSEISHDLSDKVYATALPQKRAIFTKVLNLQQKNRRFTCKNALLYVIIIYIIIYNNLRRTEFGESTFKQT